MRWKSAFLLTAVAAFATPVRAGTLGFVEDFDAGSAGFGGGSTVTHWTSGGVGGALDGYIEISDAGRLGAFSTSSDLTGNLPADGVTGYSFWLRDTSADDNLEIHVLVGIANVNIWQSTVGFAPPDGVWQQFSVDTTSAANWTQIIGAGSFGAAIAASNRLLFRHDLAPYTQFPDLVLGSVGLDRIQVLPAPEPAGTALLGLLLASVGIARRAGPHRSDREA